MSNFDFETIFVRENSDSLKYDVPLGVLPLSIADMDFATCPAVLEAVKKRASEGIFGYVEPKDSWYQSYISFFRRRHGLEIQREDMTFITGVVPALSCSVRCFSKVGDHVVAITPVYNIFFHSIENNGRKTLMVPLLKNEEGYALDFKKIEEAFALPSTSLCLFCNPQNPIGIIWKKEDLARIARLAKKYGVTILSDEIHGEIVEPGQSYCPFFSSCPEAEEVGVMATSPTKCFNLAGIQTACVVVKNPLLREKIRIQINQDEVGEPNVFSCLAAEAAWNQGEAWLEEAKKVLFSNRRLAENYIEENIPGIKPIRGEATYLLWIDASKVCKDSEILCEFLQKDARVALNPGSEYGLGGEGYLRMNLAYPKKVLLEGLKRLKIGIEHFK